MATGYEALRTSAAWLKLSARGKLRVTGEDAGRLLHAMSTNDIKSLEPSAGLYAFFLNDKGRILADANIFRLGEEFWLDTEPELAGKLYQHLDKYIIADDAYVTDESGGWFEAGVEGPASEAAMQKLGLPAPQKPFEILELGDGAGYVARLANTGGTGFRTWLKSRESWKPGDLPEADAEAARIVRLENGLPRYGEDISERYLVQETQQFRAVHFNKGCYLGQEIVERIRAQGKVHRLLTPIRIAGAVVPAVGTKLFSGSATAGEISSVVYSPNLGEVVGLAYLRDEILETGAEMRVEGGPIVRRVNL